jgi:lipid A 3-O-deacylase
MLHTLVLTLTALNFEYQPIDVAAATAFTFDGSTAVYAKVPEEVQTEEVAMTPSPASTWGTAGTWRWGISGGYATDVKDSDNTLATLGVDFEYFLEDELGLHLGFYGMDVDQTGPNATGFNFTLQLRWHFIAKETWSMFLEGGAGLLRTSEKVPSGGSRFNFTPQAGLGFTFDIGNNARWLIGAKWHHISNANIYDTNPGRDSIMYWTGISFPF